MKQLRHSEYGHGYVVIVVIALFLHCIFKIYSSIRLSSYKCVKKTQCSVFMVKLVIQTDMSTHNGAQQSL